MKDINYPKPSYLPDVLSIDEFKGNTGGQKFQTILTDPANHKVLDILPSRTQVQVSEYLRSFSNRKAVKYFIMDMNRVYLDIAKTYYKIKVIKRNGYGFRNFENFRNRILLSMH